jgi:hypothetical protein
MEVSSGSGRFQYKGPCHMLPVTKVQPITGHEGPGERRDIALRFLQPQQQTGCVDTATIRPLYSRPVDPIPMMQEAGFAPGSVGTGAENLISTGVRSPDCPGRSVSALC